VVDHVSILMRRIRLTFSRKHRRATLCIRSLFTLLVLAANNHLARAERVGRMG
jgi:hypothetical protein